MRFRGRTWTKDEIDRLFDLRDNKKLTFGQIAEELDRTQGACNVAYYGRLSGERGRTERKSPKGSAGIEAAISPRVSGALLADRDARREASYRRNITAEFFGDPPPGFSHLDKVRSVASASHPNQNNETQ